VSLSPTPSPLRSSHLHSSPSFFFNHPAPTEIYTLSLHDALPISGFAAEHLSHADGIGVRDHGALRVTRGAGRVAVDGHVVRHHRSEEHTSELQSLTNLVCRLLLEKKKITKQTRHTSLERHE